jgi:menaquinol-cytochrome c reductase iron-sulfur subunit
MGGTLPPLASTDPWSHYPPDPVRGRRPACLTPAAVRACIMSENDLPPDGAPRRNFIAAASALVLGAVAGLTPVVPGLATVLDPLRRKGADQGFVLVTRLAGIPDDGVPKRFTVMSDRKDAWTTYRDTPVGAIYLRRSGNDIAALNVVCPHAGCFINVAPDNSRFACPCHRSSFALDGSIDDPNSPSPRDMDTLEVEIRNEDEVWVRFQNFQPGHSAKLPVV